MEAAWARKRPIYQVNFDAQTPEGSFRAFERRLPGLRRLGAGILYLQPIHEIGRIVADPAYLDAHGGTHLPVPQDAALPNRQQSLYCVRDHFSIRQRLGSGEDFRRLVDAIHALGMLVILDFVPNHTAWDHVLTESHPDWYRRNAAGAVRWAGPWKDVAQLDFENRSVWEYMLEAHAYWVREFDVDGFRGDVAGMLPPSFWAWLRPRLQAVKPLFMLAEGDEVSLHPSFDTTYDWNIQPCFWKVLHFGRPVTILDEMLATEVAAYSEPFVRMRHITNHDIEHGDYPWSHQKQIDTEFLDMMPLQEKYGEAVPACMVLCATLPHSQPMVWNGQELGIIADTPKPLPWEPHAMMAFYGRLFQLFQQSDALRAGDFSRINKENAKVYAFVRALDGERIVILANLSGEKRGCLIDRPGAAGAFVELFSGGATTVDMGQTLTLDPWAARILVSEEAFERIAAQERP